MNLLNSYTALRTGCTPGKTLNCLAHSMHVSALRSRRSLRSLARYARSTILKIFLYVVDAKSRSTISEILLKLLPKSIQNPFKFALKSIQNRIQIDLGSVLASELHFSSILTTLGDPFCTHFPICSKMSKFQNTSFS